MIWLARTLGVQDGCFGSLADAPRSTLRPPFCPRKRTSLAFMNSPASAYGYAFTGTRPRTRPSRGCAVVLPIPSSPKPKPNFWRASPTCLSRAGMNSTLQPQSSRSRLRGADGIVRCRLSRSNIIDAQGIEARRAKTEGLGA